MPIDRYFRIREPGEYTVRVLYHNHVTIADDGTAGLIVFESKPFKLKVVSKRVISFEPGDREAARVAVAALDEKDPVRFVIGGYGREYHQFVSPDSPAGRLHVLSWRAVPAMLDALRDEKLTPTRRAWVLGLLFAITGDEELSPLEFSANRTRVLGPFEAEGSFGDLSGPDGKLDVEEQKKLAARWLKFGDEYLDVREAM